MPSDIKPLDITLFGKTPPTVRSESFRNIYSNTAKIGISPWDLRITYGNLIEGAPNEATNEELVTVVMSPQYAKQVAKQWQQILAQYEAAFGAIPDALSVIESAKKESNEAH